MESAPKSWHRDNDSDPDRVLDDDDDNDEADMDQEMEEALYRTIHYDDSCLKSEGHLQEAVSPSETYNDCLPQEQKTECQTTQSIGMSSMPLETTGVDCSEYKFARPQQWRYFNKQQSKAATNSAARFPVSKSNDLFGLTRSTTKGKSYQPIGDQTADFILGNVKKSIDETVAKSADEEQYRCETDKETALVEISVCSENAIHTASEDLKHRRRNSHNEADPGPAAKKKRPQDIESNPMDHVLNSMLDEESRSSLDESSSIVQTLASQAKNDPSIKTVSTGNDWSVGMSWEAMSSKYSFEIDSVDGESTCSAQMKDLSTPDVVKYEANNSDLDANNDSLEPSRYDKSINVKCADNEEKKKILLQGSCSDSDDESIVELTAPSKPAPLLFNVSSDTDEETQLRKQNEEDEITVLFCKQSETSESMPKCKKELKIVLKKLTTKTCREAISQPEEKRKSSVCNNTSDLVYEKYKIWFDDPITAARSLDHENFTSKMNDNPQLWYMCPNDRHPSRRSSGIRCKLCNNLGHKSFQCPEPPKIVCLLCGDRGHKVHSCHRLVCLKCGDPSRSKFCRTCNRIQNNICKICKLRGHLWDKCPDLWRRYHLTTKDGPIIKPSGKDVRPAKEFWCCNCARKGHLSDTCQIDRWTCEAISPLIANYEEPIKLAVNLGDNGSSALILLTDENATLLNSVGGDEFLTNLSENNNVTINFDHTSAHKRITLKGVEQVFPKVKHDLMNWITFQNAARKKSSTTTDCSKRPKKSEITDSDQVLTAENIAECSSKNEAGLYTPTPEELKIGLEKSNSLTRSANFLPNYLPTSLWALVERVYSEFESLRLLSHNIPELYQSYLQAKENSMQKEIVQYRCRALIKILLGQGGLGYGLLHAYSLLQELKRVVTLRYVQPGDRERMFDHYKVLFCAYHRDDFADLVKLSQSQKFTEGKGHVMKIIDECKHLYFTSRNEVDSEKPIAIPVVLSEKELRERSRSKIILNQEFRSRTRLELTNAIEKIKSLKGSPVVVQKLLEIRDKYYSNEELLSVHDKAIHKFLGKLSYATAAKVGLRLKRWRKFEFEALQLNY